MNWIGFRKFFLYYFLILILMFSIVELGLFLFCEQKVHLSVIILFIITLITSFSMGFVGSYLSKQQLSEYNVNDITGAINAICKSLNSSSYICNNEKNKLINNELVFLSNSRVEKYYGKVYVNINDNTIVVKAAKIVFLKYINKLNL